MKLIHSYEFCRDIAIWYDEFLIPGENFDEAIQKAMTNSNLMTISVTPSLLEESNYVMEHEFPDAKALKLPIIPVILSPTDRESLKKNYENIPEPVDSFNVDALALKLRSVLEKTVNLENKSNPEHIFLIGLAYLNGIDVEIDRKRGVEMITYAAEHNVIDAIRKLVSMYRFKAAERNKAIDWQKKLVDLFESSFEMEKTEDNAINFIDSLRDLGNLTKGCGRNSEVGQIYQKMLEVSKQAFSIFKKIWSLNKAAVSYVLLGDVSFTKGDLNTAKKYYEKSLSIRERLARQTDSVAAQRNLYINYDKLGDFYKKQGDLDSAEDYYKKAISISERLAEQTDSVEAQRDLSVSYDNFGDFYKKQGDLDSAEDYYKKALSIRERLARQTDSVEAQMNLYMSYDNLGDILEKQGDLDNAKEYYKKSLFINERLADKLKTPLDDYNVVCCYHKIGLLCTRKERVEWLNKAEKILRRLYECYPNEPFYTEMFKGMLKIVENDISETEL